MVGATQKRGMLPTSLFSFWRYKRLMLKTLKSAIEWAERNLHWVVVHQHIDERRAYDKLGKYMFDCQEYLTRDDANKLLIRWVLEGKL